MKVVIVATKSITIQSFFIDFITYCCDQNIEVTVYCNNANKIKISEKIFLHKSIFPNTMADLLKVFPIIYAIKNSISFVKNQDHDSVFLLNTPIASYIFRLINFFLKRKMIYFVHGFRFHPGQSKLTYFLFSKVENFLSRSVNGLVCINSHDCNYIKNSICKKFIRLNGVGIPADVFRHNDKVNKLQNGCKKNFIIVSAYKKDKGYLDLVTAINSGKLNKEIHITCYGYGNFEKFKKMINKNYQSKISFNGFISNVQEKISEADFFLHLSYREGLSVSVMQAMSLRTLVIATDIRGCNDLIKKGESGYLINSKSSNEIISFLNNIINISNLDYERITHNAYHFAHKELLARKQSVKLLNFINAI
jgi:glycosyltransferase involved in cell wall biosynthesis